MSDTSEFKFWVYKLLASKTLDSLWKLFVSHFPKVPIIITPTSSRNPGGVILNLHIAHLAHSVHPPVLLILLPGYFLDDASCSQHPTAITLIQLLVISPYTIAEPPHCHFYLLVLFPSAPSFSCRHKPWRHPWLLSSLTSIWFINTSYRPFFQIYPESDHVSLLPYQPKPLLCLLVILTLPSYSWFSTQEP